MATIHDVAREANVSISTVSRVLSGANNVLPETRAHVTEVIQRLNYHPNRLAQQFRTQRTKTILVIVPDVGNAYFSDVLSGIEYVAGKKGFAVLIMNSHNNGAHELRCYEMLSQKTIDGVITFSVNIPEEKIAELGAQHPIVVGGRYFMGDVPASVSIDNKQAQKDITSYMLNLGHRKICYLAGSTDVLLYQARLAGYLEAFQEYGLRSDESLIVHCDPSAQGAYDAIFPLVSSMQVDFTAIVSSGDSMAFGAIRALEKNHISVPGDVAVTGFDDIEMASLFQPPLTTVRQPRYQIGVRTAEKLFALIAEEPVPARQDILDYELVIRKSSGNHISTVGR